MVRFKKREENSVLGNKMIRRIATTIAFVILGFASVLVWNQTDIRLCQHFPDLCKPSPGSCGGSDSCSANNWMAIPLFLIIFGPSVVFGVVGYTLSKRHAPIEIYVLSLLGLVAIHWLLDFLGTRVISL